MRRIDCDGDAKISYDDFRDFFNPAMVSASCMLDPMQASAERRSEPKAFRRPYEPDHRADRMETEARLGANIERLL